MLKKLTRTSMWYMIIGLFFGVYAREFKRFNDFTGDTQINVLHTHALILGMFFFLIVLLLESQFQLSNHKFYKRFNMFYQSGLGLSLLIMLIHGSMIVLGYESSAMMSGIAGIGHILLTIGLGFFFKILFDQVALATK
ncbi:DUF2871 domain-containing protein [Aerococcaceae bacterium WGS1372]